MPFPPSKKRGISAFAIAMVTLPLATFTAVFMVGGPPETGAVTVPDQQGPDQQGPYQQSPYQQGPEDTETAHFSRCASGSRTTCVVDGDTIWLRGTKIRIADINTPEVSSPDCDYEAQLGDQATDRLIDLLNDGNFALENIDRNEDRYGRKLRIVTRGGSSLGAVLVEEGLAEEWTGRRRNWCGPR